MAIVIEADSTMYEMQDPTENYSIDVPTNIASGDKVVLINGGEDSAENPNIWFPVSGFTEHLEYGNSGGQDCQVGIQSKTAGSSEPSTYDVTTEAGADYFVAKCLRITGASTDAIIIGTPSGNDGSSESSRTANSVTTPVDNCLVVAVCVTDGADMAPFTISGTGWGTDVSPDETLTSAGGNAGVAMALAYKLVPTAGASEDVTFSADSSDGMVAVQFVVKPGASATDHLAIGDAIVDAMKLGDTNVIKAYLGDTQVFPAS